jgi:hypothetical protein
MGGTGQGLPVCEQAGARRALTAPRAQPAKRAQRLSGLRMLIAFTSKFSPIIHNNHAWFDGKDTVLYLNYNIYKILLLGQ